MLTLTTEQKNIVYSDHKHVYISARAGTGKTTTLAEFVALRKSEHFLYLVYNNAIKEEAQRKFPEFVTIHTIHSLAYQAVGCQYKDKLTNNLKVENIFKGLSYFENKNLEDKDLHKLAFNIIKTISAYCNSDLFDFAGISENKLLLDLSFEYWNKMIDLGNEEILITHDGYLKLYHLQKPSLDHDYIMVDEAQDSNEVMLDIVYNQSCNKIFVGDPHQKIYGFRGALNIFDNDKYISRGEDNVFFSLTESFRFGKTIAAVANTILSDYKNESNLITGTEGRDSVVGPIDKSLPYTIITRTNAKLIDIAIESVQAGKKISINGGIESVLYSVLDAYYLFAGEKDKIKGEYLKTLNNYSHLKMLAETLKSPDNILQVYLIEKYGHALLELIELLRIQSTVSKKADIILSTAHKSKGLEFVSICLSDDFSPLYSDTGHRIERVDSEELNLIYVAVTRATHDLELNHDLHRLMSGLC